MKRELNTYYVSWVGLSRNGDGLDVPVRAKSFEHAARIIAKRHAREFDSESHLTVFLTKTFEFKDME